MASEIKARVQLLNETTGDPIGDVEIITAASEILYTNKNKMPQQVGAIKENTVFENTPVSEILDGLLYPYTAPSVSYISISNGDIPSSTNKEVTIYKESGVYVNPFTFSATIKAGTVSGLTGTLKIYKEDSTVSIFNVAIETTIGSSYNIEFEVPELTMDSTLEFSISDGENAVYGPSVNYDFINPAYVGFAPSNVLDDNGELTDMDQIVGYFNVVINNSSPNLKKYITGKTDLYQMIRTDVNYDTKEKLHPCIVIPKSWGNALSVVDMNGNNISKSYAVATNVMLTTNSNVSLEYIVLVHRDSFYNNESILKTIKYNFSVSDGNINLLGYEGKQIPILTGFDVKYAHPIDSRCVVETYEDLLKIQFPYAGLLVYVKDIRTFFKFENDNWVVTANRLYVVESTGTLTAEFGGWDDVAINTVTGAIYRKRYNDVWELWGTLGTSGGIAGSGQSLRFRYEYSKIEEYVNNEEYIDLVYYNGSTYYCKETCTGITPSANDSHWGYFTQGAEAETSYSDDEIFEDVKQILGNSNNS